MRRRVRALIAAGNVAPVITSASTVNCAENATLSHSLTANESVTWSIVGGADQARYEISGSTLRWASNGTKDFEAPDDADTNNTYVVTVRATDTGGLTTDQTITVTVTDVGESVGIALIYTGTGSSQGVTGAGFSPDLAFVKARDATTGWRLVDNVRGVGNSLVPDGTGAETVEATGLTAFGADGITVGADTDYNNNTINYLALALQEFDGAFDIVTYTGTGVAHTIAHGLGVVPELIIVKNRGASLTNWTVYPGPLASPGTKFLRFSTSAVNMDSTIWNDTGATSSVFTVGTDSAVNSNATNYVAYLFASKTGVTSIGTYTGNGTDPGPAVTTGFTPRFVLCKRTNSTGNWVVFDNTRDASSPHGVYSLLNSNVVEATVASGGGMAFSGTGFQHTGGTDSALVNVSGGAYIYLAVR